MPDQLRNEPLPEDEANLSDYWSVLVKRRALILRTVCIIPVIVAFISLLFPDIYQSKVVIIPLGTTSSLASALGELGTLLPITTSSSTNPAAKLLAVLQSRTLAEGVIKRLDLLPLLFADNWSITQQRWLTDEPPTIQDAVKALTGIVLSLAEESKGVITITAQHADPVVAAAIANAYVEGLQKAMNDNAFSLAKKHRIFMAEQLQKAQQDLNIAEESLRSFEEKYGIVALDAQTQAAVATLAGLEGQIMAKEVQLGVLQRSLTGSSREVSLLQEELRGLRTQLARIQHGTPGLATISENQISTTKLMLAIDKAPEMKLQYVRLQRDALTQNKLFGLLALQLEQSKIEEARDETAFQVLDEAIPPEDKAKPKRLLIVLLAGAMSAFLGITLAFVFEYFDTTIQTAEQVERQAHLPIMATIPIQALSRRRSKQPLSHTPELVLHSARHAPTVEALRYLHARLKHLKDEQGIQTVLLTSVRPEEDATVTLANLAIVAAQLGDRTLLLDSNLRQPTVHSIVQGTLTPGLTESLSTNEPLSFVQTTAVDHLSFLAAGSMTSSTLGLLESPTFDALLVKCKGTYDFVLCSAPAVLSCTDAAVLGSKMDATCLVLTQGISRLEAINEARAVLEAVQTNLIGAILLSPSK